MLFELFPYPMHIVIKCLTPSTFYITSKNQRPVTSTSGKVEGARLTRFMVMSTIEVQKKITHPGSETSVGLPGQQKLYVRRSRMRPKPYHDELHTFRRETER